MAERTLNNRFMELEDALSSIDAIKRRGTSNDLLFFIFDYSPKEELAVRQETQKLKERNSEIVEMDLYAMMNTIIEEEGYMDDILQMEADYDKDLLLREVFQPLLSVGENGSRLLEMFKQVPDDGEHIILITGVGKVFPVIRSHTILNNLDSVFRRNPVVMMYPGRYEKLNYMTLRLFERLDDTNYYRASKLAERGIEG